MIGKKTLSEIRSSLKAASQEVAENPDAWLNEQLQKLTTTATPKPQEIETLNLIRNALQTKAPATKRVRKSRSTEAAK